MEIRKIILITLVFLIIYVGVDYSSTKMHESSHERIQIYYGRVNSTKDINTFRDSFTRCYEYRNRTQDEREIEYVLHSINEIVSYNISTINMLIMLIGLVIVIFISKNGD